MSVLFETLKWLMFIYQRQRSDAMNDMRWSMCSVSGMWRNKPKKHR